MLQHGREERTEALQALGGLPHLHGADHALLAESGHRFGVLRGDPRIGHHQDAAVQVQMLMGLCEEPALHEDIVAVLAQIHMDGHD